MKSPKVMVLVALALAGAMVVPGMADAKRKKARRGVFGTINGKAFKATNLLGVGDACVRGSYVPGEQLVLQAIECGPKARRRQGTAVKKNYKTLVVSCIKVDQTANTSIPPFMLACPGSGYSEAKTGRYRQPVSMTQWGATFATTPGAVAASSLNVRIDAVDGENVRGAFVGSFDLPIAGPGSEVPAAISGEVTFDVPLELR